MGAVSACHDLERLCNAHPYFREAAVFTAPAGIVAVVVLDTDALDEVGTSNLRGAARVGLAEVFYGRPPGARADDFVATLHPLPRRDDGGIDYDAVALVAQRRWDRSAAPLLRAPMARHVWTWLQRRFADRVLAADTSPALDLALDSIDWLELILDLEKELAAPIDDALGAQPLTLGEFTARFEACESAPAARAIRTGLSELLAPQQDLTWLQRPNRFVVFAAAILHGLLRLFVRSYFRLTVAGLEHLPAEGPFIIALNHVSDIDVAVVPAALPVRTALRLHFGGDGVRLFHSPLLRLVSRIGQVFPVDDRKPAVSLALAMEVLRRGGILNWFPEMWRSPDGMLQPFLRGASVLASCTGTPVVPACIEGTFELMPRWRKFPSRGPVCITFGKPIVPAATPDRDRDITQAIHDAIKALQAEGKNGPGRQAFES